MSEPFRTGDTLPMGQALPPLRLEALAWMEARVGQRETAPNQGPIVTECLEGLTRHDPAGDEKLDAGWAAWCSYAVGQAHRQAILARGDEALLKRWLRIANGEAPKFWQNLCAQGDDDGGWAWVAGPDAPLPEPGDIVFFGAYVGGVLKIRHVGMVRRCDSRIYTVEGNCGNAMGRKDYALDDPDIVAWARVPW